MSMHHFFVRIIRVYQSNIMRLFQKGLKQLDRCLVDASF